MSESAEKKHLSELVDVTMGQSPESKFYNETGDGLPFHQGVADFGDRFVTNRIYTTALNRLANEQLRVLHVQNEKLRAARDLLLPRLMSGEISV